MQVLIYEDKKKIKVLTAAVAACGAENKQQPASPVQLPQFSSNFVLSSMFILWLNNCQVVVFVGKIIVDRKESPVAGPIGDFTYFWNVDLNMYVFSVMFLSDFLIVYDTTGPVSVGYVSF